jgi:phage-related tail protein
MSNRKSHRRSNKNFVGKSVSKGVNMVKSTSKKYMPKVKSSLENVGSVVSSTAQNLSLIYKRKHAVCLKC